ncbi:MAG: PepSY-associated TM helix domain-containing protein [Bacteroidota bacterium]
MRRFFSFFQLMIRHQKKWFAQWHAWAGIFAGSILIVVSLTGTLLVFEEELDVWLYPELFEFEKSGEVMPLNQVFHQIRAEHPRMHFESIFQFPKRNGCYMSFYEDNDEFRQAVINPYTAEITGTRVYGDSVMGFIRNLHRTLLVPKVGKYIVGIASLFMVILMITGLRLWIPKHWGLIKERLTIKKGASFKRQNYDLHNSLGFYFSPFITLISITGVAITFSPFVVLALFLVNFQSPQSIGDILGKQSTYVADNNSLGIDHILTIAATDMPEAEIRGFSIPRDSVGVYNVNFTEDGYAVTGDNSFAMYDQYTGERLLNTDKDFANSSKLVLNWLTPIHYGTFGGMTTRIIALLASIAAPILFITGFIIWWGRWKKRHQKSSTEDHLEQPKSDLNGGSNKKQKRPVIPQRKETVTNEQ